ncbi:MAG: nucleoside-diphosphate kinase [SAR202 cluster bacterium]|nr:nucleoside-diphosphate kinase [SAR202 cluster bacterium]
MQKTLVLLKPDAVQRGLVGELVSRLERKGLKLVGMKLVRMDNALARQHYAEHVDKPFFKGLAEFITSGPLVAMAIEGEDAIGMVRTLMGETNPANATPGTVRGDYAVSIGLNLVHGSDSPESAQRELALFFEEDEILEYDRATDPWIIES